jgi:RES domain-containing protein
VNWYRGTVWRHVPVGAVPQHLGWILKAARGRWNTQRPRMPCIYTALTPEGAIAELDKHADQFAGRRRRRDLVSLAVEVHTVLDLTSRFVRARHRIDAARLVSDRPADLAYCHAIAREFVLEHGYGAIRAPSAAVADRQNLIIYMLRTDHIRRLDDGPDRITILPGYRWPPPP